MKKTTTAVATAGLIGLSTLGLSAPAVAATDIGDLTFYTVSDFAPEVNPYATDAWFWGNVNPATYPDGTGTATSSATGLNISNTATQATQPMTTVFTQPANQTEFEEYASSMWMEASNSDWTMQIAVFGEPGEADLQFTTLRPETTGNPSNTTLWQSSRAIGGLAANTSLPLSDYLDVLYAGVAPEVLAVGAFVDRGTSTSLYAFAAFDEASVFTPIPTRTITPNPVTVTTATGDGIRFVGTGWFPNSTVYISIGLCDSDVDEIYLNDDIVADALGNVDVTVVLEEAPALGEYCVYFDDDSLLYFDGENGAQPQLTLTFVAAAAAPALAATGTEASVGLIAGAGALVLGLGALLLAKRRVAANR